MSRKRRVASSSTAEPSAALRESVALQHPLSNLAAPDQSMLKPAGGHIGHAAVGQHPHALALRTATCSHPVQRALWVTLRACQASMWHAACRCDALDISSLLTDAAAAVVDDSFLRQACRESSSS